MGRGLAAVLTPNCSCSPSSVSRLMLEEEPTPASGVHPPPQSLPQGDIGGPLAVTPCAWSDPRPLPQHGSSPPQPGNPTSHRPPPKGLRGAQGGTGQRPWEEGATAAHAGGEM